MKPEAFRPVLTHGFLPIWLVLLLASGTHVCMGAGGGEQVLTDESQRNYTGGLNRLDDVDRPRPVRNGVARIGEPIVTLRYFRIQKGSFDEFLGASVEGVWPYFEKLGARVIGMWQVTVPAELGSEVTRSNDDYDEVYLATRYAGFAHWKATRDTVKHGGNGPDWQKCKAALALRRGLTLATDVKFLKGTMAPSGPYFMPGLDERYELVGPDREPDPSRP